LGGGPVLSAPLLPTALELFQASREPGVCCFSLNALPRINTHRITHVINSRCIHDRKEPVERGGQAPHKKKKEKKKKEILDMVTAAGRKDVDIGE